MDIKSECILSMYKELAPVSGNPNVCLAQSQNDGRLYIKKTLTEYSPRIYYFLKEHPIPGVPVIYEICRKEEKLVLIEEYIHGENLADILKYRAFTEEETVRAAVSLCRILDRLHGSQPPIIHRDIKPSNIMITPDRTLRLIDFNISREFSPDKDKDTRIMGTASYAAPEQFGFSQSDGRTDLYAVGVLMKEMMGDHLPSSRLARLIEKCMSIDPDKRYQSASSLLRALNSLYPAAILPEEASGRIPVRSWAPPGFRSGIVWKTLLSACGYLFLLYICCTIVYTRDGVPASGFLLVTDRICTGIFLFFLVFLIGNYRGMAAYFPPCKSPRWYLRAAGYILYGFLVLLAEVLISSIVLYLFQ
ncbi:serine/threonine protein kinase [Qiania dongpingensis]|uniref:non-specific serine/threonine protein kinase n=1 Tax=Qiania dongpingensis TaxID=2763669 RepID=A0A7G9G6U2_9FIRM|nr:serine/threonine-protein kinase [Qiania dongpingensis]QNM06524.1 serine/threonine protein kinase [Qiania dongpingensis]